MREAGRREQRRDGKELACRLEVKSAGRGERRDGPYRVAVQAALRGAVRIGSSFC
jgi:hypothetical protein